MSFRAGIVAVVGRPNVGKSTLVNTVVGHKVSIVSDKPQTTRKRIMGVATTDDFQIVFVDTPGVHAAKHKLGKALNEAARQTMHGVDVLLVVVDGSKPPNKDDQDIARMVGAAGDSKRLLCINKMDLLKAADVQERYDAYTALFPADETMMTSLTKRQNVDLLVGLLVSLLPESEPLYEADTLTDQPMRALAAELVREKALHLTREEVPHALATYVEAWDEDEKLAHVSVVLLVERDGQKRILIGKKGEMLKKIGSEARVEIEDLLGKKVFLELFVKVRADWRDNAGTLRELEYL
jgi:GTP-binding protein Era